MSFSHKNNYIIVIFIYALGFFYLLAGLETYLYFFFFLCCNKQPQLRQQLSQTVLALLGHY